MVTEDKVLKIVVGFHAGNVITYLSQSYGDAKIVIREAIQNALDKHAKHIYIVIDFVRRSIRIFDDGLGASQSEVTEKFKRIGLSNKIGRDEILIGHNGIGNLAGIAVAIKWQLITRDVTNPRDKLRSYELDTVELRKSDDVQVHSEEWPGGKITQETSFIPTTMVRLTDVNDFAFQSLRNFSALKEVIEDSFDAVLREKKTEVRISYKKPSGKIEDFHIKPSEFRGSKQDSVTIETKYGEVRFDLYVQPHPVQNPKILVQHGGVFNIALKPFVSLGDMEKKYEQVWTSGYFEGVVHLGFCTPNPSRSYFQKDDEFGVFLSVIKEFADSYLQPMLDSFQESARGDRYKKIADKVLGKVLSFYKMNPNMIPAGVKQLTSLGSKLPDFEIEGLGFGKNLPKKKNRIKKSPVSKSILVDNKKKRQDQRRNKERSVAGAGKSGLAIIFTQPSEEVGFKWHSKVEDGLIKVNLANKHFLQAEKFGMTKLTEFVLLLVQKELTCLSFSPSDADLFSKKFEQDFMDIWSMNLSGS